MNKLPRPQNTQKIMGFFYGVRNDIQVFWRYKNWREILNKTRKKETITKVVLRNGIQIEAPKSHPMLLSVVNETFFNKIHTLQDISIRENDVVVDIGANIDL